MNPRGSQFVQGNEYVFVRSRRQSTKYVFQTVGFAETISGDAERGTCPKVRRRVRTMQKFGCSATVANFRQRPRRTSTHEQTSVVQCTTKLAQAIAPCNACE
jgi:hypothetical protein